MRFLPNPFVTFVSNSANPIARFERPLEPVDIGRLAMLLLIDMEFADTFQTRISSIATLFSIRAR